MVDGGWWMVEMSNISIGRLTAAAGSAPAEPPLSAPAALTKIFESVAVIIEDQVPVVDSHFGSGSAITVCLFLPLFYTTPPILIF